jgi:hypothetical protein
MYGLVNKAIQDLITTRFGVETWEQIKQKAGVDTEVFISNDGYPDEITYQLVGASVEVLGLPAEQILIAFGEHWVVETAAKSYGPMMKAGGASLREFLVNLPNFHSRVFMIYPHLQPPRFECTDVTNEGLTLHYHTHRLGLTSFVTGLLQGLGTYYGTPCTSEVIARKDEGADHDVFAVSWKTIA